MIADVFHKGIRKWAALVEACQKNSRILPSGVADTFRTQIGGLVVQLKYFGDARDYFKYDLITSVFEAKVLYNYSFIPMLTEHRQDNEGNRRPVTRSGRSEALYEFMTTRIGKSLNHWEDWLSQYVASYKTVKPADVIFFRNESRDDYWKMFRPLAGIEKALVFLDPDTGLETGKASYQRRMGPEKYIQNNELKDMFDRLHPESIMMIYQHLPNDKRVHSEATRKKLDQTRTVCAEAMISAYREDDLSFIFIAKSQSLFKMLEYFLSVYYEKSSSKYKELIHS